jgi:hypothetical protein
VLSAASATPEKLLVISPLLRAASLTLRNIPLVVAFCSSTAVAVVPEMLLIWLMTSEMVAMTSTAAYVSVWIASILRPMSSVALSVFLASSITSFATTAKPLPASPWPGLNRSIQCEEVRLLRNGLMTLITRPN